jgi:hypothetical protein
MRPPVIYPFPMSGTAGMGIGIIVSMAIDVYYKEQMNVDFKKRLEENRKAIEDMTNRLLRP